MCLFLSEHLVLGSFFTGFLVIFGAFYSEYPQGSKCMKALNYMWTLQPFQNRSNEGPGLIPSSNRRGLEPATGKFCSDGSVAAGSALAHDMRSHW